MIGSYVTHRYQLVVYKATRRGTCPVCGKKGTRTSGTQFSQTVNPFNKSSSGSPKTYREIMEELCPKAQEWEKKQFYHVKCEQE